MEINKMVELSLMNIEKSYGVDLILKDINFCIQTGDKIGLIGVNGSGKTTIFKIIANLENYSKGESYLRKGAKLSYLNQIPEFPIEYKVIEVLNEAFDDLDELNEKLKKVESEMAKSSNDKLEKLIKKYGNLQEQFEKKGGYEIENKIKRICTGLKIDENLKNREFNTLSGGEKTRIMLGKILLENPDIILLDEPTNNLDIESLEWFEDYLKEYKGTVLIISHDRYFLDKIVNKVIEIEDGKSETYYGNYSYYHKEKERKLVAQFDVYKTQQKKIKAMREAIKRFIQWGRKGDNPKMYVRARNMEKRIERMEKIDKPVLERKKMGLGFSTKNRSGNDVVRVNELYKSFGDITILNNVDFFLSYKEKVVLLGKNGSGKTTFIKILLNEIEYDKGEVIVGSNVKIGYLKQKIEFDNYNKTLLETFIDEHNIPQKEARGILAKFLFFGDKVFNKISELSGGELVRFKLCQIMHKDINLLILDEPTNHLDIDSREVLEEALLDFKGTILLISHDRYFINKIVDRVIEIDNKKLVNFYGNYDYYKTKKIENNSLTKVRDFL